VTAAETPAPDIADLRDVSIGADPRGVSIGAAAAHLGVAPETVRSWGRRYGIVPTTRTAGGHRRFSAEDMTRLVRMRQLVGDGMAPAEAARRALAEPAAAGAMDLRLFPARRGAGRPIRRDRGLLAASSAVRAAPPETRALARALANGLDDEAQVVVRDLLAVGGALRLWEAVEPLWTVLNHRSGTDAPAGPPQDYLAVLARGLREHRARQVQPMRGRAVVVACWPDEPDDLAVHIVAASLAERCIPVRLARVREPVAAFMGAVAEAGASAVFLWRRDAGGSAPRHFELPHRRPLLRLVVGGPGWDGIDLPTSVRRADSLRQATAILRATVC